MKKNSTTNQFIKNHLRNFLVSFLKKEWVDYIRYVNFVRKLKNFYENKIDWEPEMEALPELLRGKSNLWLDIGANYGAYAFFLSKLNENAKIISFEPILRSYKILLKVIKKFNLKNVNPINMALGNSEGIVNMAIPNKLTGLAHICSKKEESDSEFQEVKIGKLDNSISKSNRKKVDFIKCDVEGKELDVFKGAVKTIKNSKPLIFCEVEQRHTDRYGIDANEVISFLSKIDYKVFFYKDKKLIGTDKILEDKPNYFFIHKSKIESINPILFS